MSRPKIRVEIRKIVTPTRSIAGTTVKETHLMSLLLRFGVFTVMSKLLIDGYFGNIRITLARYLHSRRITDKTTPLVPRVKKPYT